jgi:hypothetical protein
MAMVDFEPIDNQRFANLVGCLYNDKIHRGGSLFYGITHSILSRFKQIAQAGPCILLTTYSDGSVTDEMADRLPANVQTWFSTNVMTDNPRVRPIPIGFIYNWERTNLLMELVKKERPQPRNILYVNFFRAIPRAVNPRVGLYETFGDKGWATCEGGDKMTRVSSEAFYEGIRSHDYVLSPPGAGPDCHRHWESMALGSVPIVLRSKATEILNDMPCLQVDNWEEVTEQRLKTDLFDLRQRFDSDSMKKLDMNYWREEIGKCLESLS